MTSITEIRTHYLADTEVAYAKSWLNIHS